VSSQSKTLLVWLGLIVAVLALANMFETRNEVVSLPYSKFYETVKRDIGDLKRSGGMTIAIDRDHFTVSYILDGKMYESLGPNDPALIEMLKSQGIDFRVEHDGASDRGIFDYVAMGLPSLLVLLLMGTFIRGMRSNTGGAYQFGKSRARKLEPTPEGRRTTFKDVAGAPEAVESLQEIVDFLKDPRKYRRIGARIPKGCLLVGPPGCGKTLLARAVAGEAGVAFFSISGSDFVEVFVGVGAARVRDLFDQGRKQAPCVLFIDELDAVGRKRGSGIGSGHDEREQTLNQLLVAMDGFESNDGVVVLAATNRVDVLDKALIRPGRFDRQVEVPLPKNVESRAQIIAVHRNRMGQIFGDVDFDRLANQTAGYSGADLENLLNEAALHAVRNNRERIEEHDFEAALATIRTGRQLFSTLDLTLIESANQLSKPVEPLFARLTQNRGAVFEGEVLWIDSAYIGMRPMEGGRTVILPKNSVNKLEPLLGVFGPVPPHERPREWQQGYSTTLPRV